MWDKLQIYMYDTSSKMSSVCNLKKIKMKRVCYNESRDKLILVVEFKSTSQIICY